MTESEYAIRFMPVAVKDAREIVAFLAAERLAAADALMRKLQETWDLLARTPFLGRLARDPGLRRKGYRSIVVQEYLVFYVVAEREVVVHRVLHGARNYGELL